MDRRKFLLALSAFFAGGSRVGRVLAAAASVGSVGLHSVGPSGISARIIAGSGEVGLYNVYMGAIYQGTLYLRRAGTQDWRVNDNLGFPVAGQVNLSSGGFADITVADFDISNLTGLDAYVGYGVRESDVWLPGHLGKIYTVPGTVNGVMRYSDKTYALWTGAYPYAVTRTGVARVVNRTSVAGSAPFFNSLLAERQLTDGRILISCQESVSLARNIFYIDPTKDEMHDYLDTVPADVVFRGVQPFDPLAPTWVAKSRVSGGWFYSTEDSITGRIFLFFREDGNQTPVTVREGAFAVDGNIKLLISYSN